MKKEVIGIFICTLLIATAVLPVGGTINKDINKKNKQLDYKVNLGFVPGEFIIKFKEKAISSLSMEKLNERYNVISMEKIFRNSNHELLKNIYLAKVPKDADILSIVNDYSSYPEVEYAEPNGVASLCGIPNDPHFKNQWALHNTGQDGGTPNADIDAPEAWDMETGSSDVVIAVIDSGIDYTHPDLADNIWINKDEIPDNSKDDDNNGYVDDAKGYDWSFTDNDHYPLDKLGHGTACAGIAGAVGDNNIGITGVCWNCKIMPLQTFNDTGYSHLVWISQAIEYAADNGANVVSMSFVFDKKYWFITEALNYASEKGVVLVAAAGNAGTNQKAYPAAYNNVIAVAGTDNNDSIMNVYFEDLGRWMTSNYGYWIDVAAPGVHIYTTMPTYHVFFNDFGGEMNYTYFRGGTSLSCPYVAGLAALILSKNSSLSPEEVKSCICKNVDPYDSEVYIGTGRINAYQAVKKTKTNDDHSAESDWASIEVIMPKDKNEKSINTLFLQFLEKFLEKLPNTFSILRNLLGL